MAIPPLLIAGAVGAGIMYLLDPKDGNRRRALLRDQLNKLQNTASDRAEGLSEDIGNRARGTVAEITRKIEAKDVADETLVARIRSEMGRYVSHPKAVEVIAYNGQVTLKGHMLMDEAEPFMEHVRNMQGVEGVHNQLQMHQEAGNIPELQGGKTRTGLSS